jgi:gas vesicle protein
MIPTNQSQSRVISSPERVVFEQEALSKIVTTMDLFKLLEERRVEAQSQQDILHKRIGALRDELQKELGESHKEIMSEIKEMKEEQREHAKEAANDAKDMSDRVSNLEQWKWQMAGGVLVLAFLWPFVTDIINAN